MTTYGTVTMQDTASLTYVASVSHDLKSSLNAILGFAHMVKQDLDNQAASEQTVECLELIDTVGNEMLKLIQNMLTASRISAGREEMQPSLLVAADIRTRIKDLERLFGAEAKSRKVRFSVIVNGLPEAIHWDIIKIRYFAINNLISNALKFVGAHGEVRVEIGLSERSEVLIAVRDNGPGVPPEDHATIFRMFGQASNNAQSHSGSGLGLYNALHVVKAHRGAIEITEGLDGKGIGFLVRIPVMPFPAESMD